jgi:hypothetical protein
MLGSREKIPVIDGLALASRIRRLPGDIGRDEIVQHLCVAAVESMQTLSDLDIFEAYADSLQLAISTVSPTALEIINSEFGHLIDEPDPEAIRSRARELQARARIYGHVIEIHEFLDHADDLEFS